MKRLPLQGRTLALLAVIVPLLVLFIYVGFRSGPLAPVAVTVMTVESQAVTPALQIVEALVVLACRSIHLVDQEHNGIGILITHQFANKVDMPFTGDVGRMLGYISQRYAQRIGQWQAGN